MKMWRSNRFATKKKNKVNKNKIKRSHNGFEMNDPSMLLDTSLDTRVEHV